MSIIAEACRVEAAACSFWLACAMSCLGVARLLHVICSQVGRGLPDACVSDVEATRILLDRKCQGLLKTIIPD